MTYKRLTKLAMRFSHNRSIFDIHNMDPEVAANRRQQEIEQVRAKVGNAYQKFKSIFTKKPSNDLTKVAGSGYILKRKDMVSDPDFFTDYTPEERKEILADLKDQRLAQKQMRKIELDEKKKLIKLMGPDAYARMTEDQRMGQPRDRFGYPLPTNKDVAFSARNAAIMGGLASAGTLAHAIKNKSIPSAAVGTTLGALSLIPAYVANKANKNIKAGKIYYE